MNSANPLPSPTQGHRIRRAEPGDAAAVARLIQSQEDLRQVSPQESYPLETETVLHWIVKRRAGYILEERSEIVGYAELVKDEDDPQRYWIGHMIVHPRRRGLGLGRRMVSTLLHTAEVDLLAREVAISAFEDNVRALSCYRSCGFLPHDKVSAHSRTLVDLRYRVRSRRRMPTITEQIGAAIIALIGGLTLSLMFDSQSLWNAVRAAPAVLILAALPFAAIALTRRWLAEQREAWPKRLLRALIAPVIGIDAMLAMGPLLMWISGATDHTAALELPWIGFAVCWVVLTTASAVRRGGMPKPGSLPTRPSH